MSPTERADYDDELFGPKWIRDPKLRNHTGYIWLVTWVWFLIGSTIFLVYELPRKGNIVLLLLIVNTILGCLFIMGANLVQRGYSNFLPAISTGSIMAAMFYGWWGCHIGLFMFGRSELYRPNAEGIVGVLLLVFTFGFMVLNLISLVYTIKYALSRIPVTPTSDAQKKEV